MPRASWLPGVLACIAIALGGCDGGDGNASSGPATATATPSRAPSGREPIASLQFRLEASVRCDEARRTIRAQGPVPTASRLSRYAQQARQRDGALVNALSSVLPPDDQAAERVRTLQGAYANLLPIYDRVAAARDRAELSRLRKALRVSERGVTTLAASFGVEACAPRGL